MRLRDHVAAALVLAHLVYVGIASMPWAYTLATEQGRAAISADIERVPLVAARPAVRKARNRLAKAWNEVHAGTVSVGRPYATYLGTPQVWAMFAVISHVNGRLEISVQQGEEWRVVYRERSPDATWSSGRFEFYRWREKIKQFHVSGDRNDWVPFCTWVAEEVFQAYPGAEAVKIEVLSSRVPDAERRPWGRLPFTHPVRSLTVPRARP